MLGKTVFFVDIEDISDIKKEIKDDEKIIFPLNFKSEKILRKNKVETVIPDDFLEESDYQKIDELSQELAKTWFENENLEKILNYKNINLGLMLERELGGTLLKFIHRIVLVEKILEKFQPNLVITTFSNNVIGNIPFFVSESKGFTTTKIINSGTDKNEFKFDKYSYSFDFLGKNIDITVTRKQFTYLKKMYEVFWEFLYNFSNFQRKKIKENQKTILFLDFNLVTYKSFIKHLAVQKYNLLFLNNRRPIIWNNESLEIAKKINIKKIKFSIKNKNKVFQDINRISEELNSYLNKNDISSFNIDGINFWKIFKSEFIDFCKKRVGDSILLINKMNQTLNSNRIDLVWTLDDFGQTDRTLVNVCKQQNIPVLLMQIGVI